MKKKYMRILDLNDKSTNQQEIESFLSAVGAKMVNKSAIRLVGIIYNQMIPLLADKMASFTHLLGIAKAALKNSKQNKRKSIYFDDIAIGVNNYAKTRILEQESLDLFKNLPLFDLKWYRDNLILKDKISLDTEFDVFDLSLDERLKLLDFMIPEETKRKNLDCLQNIYVSLVEVLPTMEEINNSLELSLKISNDVFRLQDLIVSFTKKYGDLENQEKFLAWQSMVKEAFY